MPVCIFKGDEQIRSPQKLANIFNDFFITKIEEIEREFEDTNQGLIEMLELLVEKPKLKFELKEIMPWHDIQNNKPYEVIKYHWVR